MRPECVGDTADGRDGHGHLARARDRERHGAAEIGLLLDQGSPGLQILTLTEEPLFPLVLRGQLLDTLYYRLNAVCLMLPSLDLSRVDRTAEAPGGVDV